jgi:hypothetical protein
MGRTKELIRDITDGARDPRRLAARTWRTVRHRRLARIGASAGVMAIAILLAVALLPGIAASASISLRTPVELRQITNADTATGACPAGSVPVPGGAYSLPLCVTRTGMTITAAQSVYLQRQFLRFPKVKPIAVYLVVIRLTPAGAAQLHVLSRDIYRLPRPLDELANIVHGHFLGYTYYREPNTTGTYSILRGSHSAAENLLKQLLHG